MVYLFSLDCYCVACISPSLCQRHVSALTSQCTAVLSKGTSAKSTQVKENIWHLLALVTSTGPEAAAAHVGPLLEAMIVGLSDTQTAVRIAATQWLSALLSAVPPSLLRLHAGAISKAVVAALDDDWHAVVAAGLSAAAQHLRAMRPLAASGPHIDETVSSASDSGAEGRGLSAVVLKWLRAREVDGDTKAAALQAAAVLASRYADVLTTEDTQSILQTVLERLQTDLTRTWRVVGVCSVCVCICLLDLCT